MKKLLLAIMLIPMLGVAQEKNVVFSARIFPKLDKIAEFEKALANHHLKFHTDNFKAVVFSVISGPDAGAYQVTMGPVSWEDFDNRKTSAEHDADWQKNVLPLVAQRVDVGFFVFNNELSTIDAVNFAEKVSLFHVYPKQGKMGAVGNLIRRAKASWEANNYSVAVYTTESSGPAKYVMATRHKTGWKEKGMKPAKSFKESLGGDSAYEDFMDDVGQVVMKAYGEMLSMRKDLGSK